MGLFESLFKKQKVQQQVQGYFKTLSAYTPTFTSFEGGVYEMELTRASIHAIATQCSKLKPEIKGNAYKELGKRLQFKPNSFMDTSKFLYRLSTILSVNNNAFIVPIMANDGVSITGYYPILPSRCEVVESNGLPYLRYTFANGQRAAIEFEKVGILTQFQYKNDFFGESNDALYPTMQLINTQNQGIIEGVKQSANIRFMVKLANFFSSKDIAAERQRFTEDNLSADNNSGIMMFDNKYADVKQIVSKPFVIDSAQMASIKNNVFNYFGVNEKILQNNFTETDFNSFYEGKIEPFAIQLSLVMTNMTFTDKEIAFGNQIAFSTSRLDYMSTENKRELVFGAFDRGFMSHNTGCEILGLPTRGTDGDKFFIRQEYIETDKLNQAQGVIDNGNEG